MSFKPYEFRNQLLTQDRYNPTLQEQYERQVREMIEKELTGWQRAGHWFGLVLGLFFVVLSGGMAIFAPSELPVFARVGLIVGAVFGAAYAALAIHILRKGTINLKVDEATGAALGWGFIVIITTLFMVNADKFPDPTKMLAVMIIFEIGAGIGLVVARIQKGEVTQQERLLEIEYKLAELKESLEKTSK